MLPAGACAALADAPGVVQALLTMAQRPRKGQGRRQPTTVRNIAEDRQRHGKQRDGVGMEQLIDNVRRDFPPVLVSRQAMDWASGSNIAGGRPRPVVRGFKGDGRPRRWLVPEVMRPVVKTLAWKTRVASDDRQ